jgi:DNA-binding NtrC family response regulator
LSELVGLGWGKEIVKSGNVDVTSADAVLLIGNDEDLVKLRGKVLKGAGFDVHEATTDAAAKASLQADGVRVVVLCHTLRDGQLNKVLDQVEGMSPPASILLLLRSGTRSHARALESADVALDPTDGPAMLIKAVRKLMPAQRI